jgi:hypothetical protein
MNEPATAVIKNNEVRMGGKVRLGAAATNPAPSVGNTGGHQAAASVARVARTAEDHVIIEVTCGCGAKTMVRCNF